MDKEERQVFFTVLIGLLSIVSLVIMFVFWGQFLSHKFTMIQDKHRYQECTDMAEKGLPLKSYCTENYY